MGRQEAAKNKVSNSIGARLRYCGSVLWLFFGCENPRSGISNTMKFTDSMNYGISEVSV